MFMKLPRNVYFSIFAVAITMIFKSEYVVSITLLSHPQDETSVAGNGSSIVLTCIFDISAPLCYWEKDDTVVEIDDRYEFNGDPNTGDCSIVINDVAYVDEGNWRCGYPVTSRAHLSTKMVKSNKATVLIAVLPLQPVISFDTVALEKGDYVYLESQNDLKKFRCWSENGSPEPTITWKIGEEIIYGHTVVTQSAGDSDLKIIEHRLSMDSNGPSTDDLIDPSWLQELLYCTVTTGSYSQETYVQLIF